MNKLFLSIFIFLSSLFYAQVGINTLTPSPASSLHVHAEVSSGNFRGFMPPRVTVAQRNLIPVTSADDGLMVYTTNADGGRKCIQMYNGSNNTWQNVQCFSTRVFFENMGEASGTTVLSSHTFNNSSTLTYSGSGVDIRITDALTGSTTANVFFSNGATPDVRNFTITGLNMTSYESPLTLSFYVRKNTSDSDGTGFTFEYRDGPTTWVSVTLPTLPTGVGSSIYHKIVFDNIPNTIQGLRFTRTHSFAGSTTQFRIDDIEIIKP